MLGDIIASQSNLEALVNTIAKKYGIEPSLLKAIIKVESNWNVSASRYEAHLNDSSWGLMQLLLSTAKWILPNASLTISQLVSPSINVEAGAKYLLYLLNQFGNIPDAVSAYNAGSPKLGKDGKYVNNAYVQKVLGNYTVYKTLDDIANAMTEATDVITNVVSDATSSPIGLTSLALLFFGVGLVAVAQK
jgi:soluble lytic murein transglycosylase-like protein